MRIRAYLLIIFLLLILTMPLHAASTFISLEDEWLNARIGQMSVLANMPSLRRPYSVAEVTKYLPLLNAEYPGLARQISAGLQKYVPDCSLTHASLAVAHSADVSDELLTSNNFGVPANSLGHASVSGRCNPSDWLSFSVGGFHADGGDITFPLGTYFVAGSDNIQLEFGLRERWLSPMQKSAMLLSNHARPSISFGISSATPLEEYWNFHYEIFVSRLEYRERILYGDQFETGRPALMGTHFSLEPLTGWHLGVTRMMLFGGGSRSVDAGSIWDAFTDPVRSDNSGRIECEEAFVNQCEFGNQIASVSSRFNVQFGIPFSLYFEYAGEDTAGHKNTRLGNIAVSAGLFFPFAFGGDWSILYEYSQWQNAWYTHHIYQDGYTNDGVVMGHWGASHRVVGDEAGATAQVLQVGWQMRRDERIELTYRQLENESYSVNDYNAAQFVELEYLGTFWRQRIGLGGQFGKDVFGGKLSRFELKWQW